MLPNCPTKTQEIAHLAEFIGALPRTSYLADIMPDVATAVEDAIRNDVGYIPINRMMADVTAAQKELAELRKTIADERRAAEMELRRLRMAADRAKSELDEVRAMARRLCVA